MTGPGLLAPPVAERASRRERPSETPHSHSYRWARSLALAALAEFFGVLCDRTLVVDSSQLFLRKWEYPLGRCTVSNIGGVYRYLLDGMHNDNIVPSVQYAPRKLSHTVMLAVPSVRWWLHVVQMSFLFSSFGSMCAYIRRGAYPFFVRF